MRNLLLWGLLLALMSSSLAAAEPQFTPYTPYTVAGELPPEGKSLIVSLRLCERTPASPTNPASESVAATRIVTRENVPASVANQREVRVT